MEVVIVILSICTVFAISRPLTCIIHEMGHAIPALMFSKSKVTVYIGSYGDDKNSYQMKMGRLNMFFSYNILSAYAGMCVSQENVGFIRRLIIILGGPLASLFSAILSLVLVYSLSTDGLVQFLVIVFACSAGLDFYWNIVPNKEPISGYDSGDLYNDGMQILDIIKNRKMPKAYFEAHELVKDGAFEEALQKLNTLESKVARKKDVLRLKIYCSINNNQFREAQLLFLEFDAAHRPDLNDRLLMVLIHMGLNELEEAMALIEWILKRQWNHIYAISNRGEIYRLKGMADNAFQDFNQVIKIDPSYHYAWSARGGLKAENNHLDDALEDLEVAEKLAPKDPYLLKNWGIYYLQIGDHQKALDYFKEAKASNLFILKIDDYISQAQILSDKG